MIVCGHQSLTVSIKTFIGHGDGINDVATSPADPSIIASAADDTTIRVWSLSRAHRKQPCVALLAGEGHQWNLLTVVCILCCRDSNTRPVVCMTSTNRPAGLARNWTLFVIGWSRSSHQHGESRDIFAVAMGWSKLTCFSEVDASKHTKRAHADAYRRTLSPFLDLGRSQQLGRSVGSSLHSGKAHL